MLEPTVFNQTDDHIIDSKLEMSPSEIYEKHIRSTLSKEETKSHIDRLIAAKEETSIERIKRKYLNNDKPSEISPQFNYSHERREKKTNAPPQKQISPHLSPVNKHIPLQNKQNNDNVKKSNARNTTKPKIVNKNLNTKPKKNLKSPAVKKVQIAHNKVHSNIIKNAMNPGTKSLTDIFTLIKMHAQQCPAFKSLLESNGFTV